MPIILYDTAPSPGGAGVRLRLMTSDKQPSSRISQSYTDAMAGHRDDQDAKETATGSVTGIAGAASSTARTAEDHRSQALWAADYAERVLPLFEDVFPGDDRPRKAIEAARAWARGEIRVSEARAAAIAAHAAARDAAELPAACAAARAAGHAAATAHMAGHAPHAAAYAKKAAALAGHGDTNPMSASNPE